MKKFLSCLLSFLLAINIVVVSAIAVAEENFENIQDENICLISGNEFDISADILDDEISEVKELPLDDSNSSNFEDSTTLLSNSVIQNVRVRTYKTVNGKKYYSAWSNVKSVKVK